MTERVLRRLTRKCTEVEEAGKMLKFLLRKGVGLASIEQFSLSQSGKSKAKVPGEKGRKLVVKEEMESVIKGNKCKVRKIKSNNKQQLRSSEKVLPGMCSEEK